MPFKVIKQIINHLKRTSSCPRCGSGISDNLIFILTTAFSAAAGSGAGLFLVLCPQCGAEAVLIVEIANKLIKVRTRTTSKRISTDEILDMHNFLKGYRGDIKELLK